MGAAPGQIVFNKAIVAAVKARNCLQRGIRNRRKPPTP